MGTYEARPGAGGGDYTNPSPNYHVGSQQGDGPTGTLRSETFTIGGNDESEVLLEFFRLFLRRLTNLSIITKRLMEW